MLDCGGQHGGGGVGEESSVRGVQRQFYFNLGLFNFGSQLYFYCTPKETFMMNKISIGKFFNDMVLIPANPRC